MTTRSEIDRGAVEAAIVSAMGGSIAMMTFSALTGVSVRDLGGMSGTIVLFACGIGGAVCMLMSGGITLFMEQHYRDMVARGEIEE